MTDDEKREKILGDLRRISRVMDTAVGIPGTRLRFGVDSVIGLLVGCGDIAGMFVSFYAMFRARQLGVSKKVFMQMLWNVLVDTGVGSIPLLGDVFDLFFKSNQRNLELVLSEFPEEQEKLEPKSKE